MNEKSVEERLAVLEEALSGFMAIVLVHFALLKNSEVADDPVLGHYSPAARSCDSLENLTKNFMEKTDGKSDIKKRA